MKKITNTYIIIFICLFSCKAENTSKNEKLEIKKQEIQSEKKYVDAIVLKSKNFKKEIISNGKLIALQKNKLKFNVSENLETLLVKNGDKVKKGQLLAKLRSFTYQQAHTKSKINLRKSELELKDKLLGRGYETFNKSNIPTEEYEMLAIRSGYKSALLELNKSKFNLNAVKLTAPFDGKIADIKNKQYEYINSGVEIMTIINDQKFEVEFYLIESEVSELSIGGGIQIIPIAIDKIYEGKITEINPKIEKDGTILVKALVKNDGQLLEGMNVKVLIQKNISNQLVVPKSSVLLRQNQEVLFSVKSGKTYWNYVKVTNQNSLQYTVIPHPDKSSSILKEGDTVITSGNLYLAHDTNVFIKSLK